MSMTIPFVNLERQHKELRCELLAAIEGVIDSGAFILSKHVSAFESEFRQAIQVDDAIGCSNGTSSLALILEGLGIGPGDEVITASHTFIATVEAISHVGAIPVLADINKNSYTLDADSVAACITSKTKAIVPVHIYGTPADMDELCDLAAIHDLYVIEDAAQAHLATYKGKLAGSIGVAGSFSFFPGKNLGALGDAGAITTNSSELATRVRSLRNHGRAEKYLHNEIGYNYRIDDIQAALLSVKLPHLEKWVKNRIRMAGIYDASLKDQGFKSIRSSPDSYSSYHLYVVEVSNRSEVIARLAEKGISTGVHYPVPMHKQPAVIDRYQIPSALPVTDKVCERIISLPICGSILDSEVEYVIQEFLACART